MLRNKSFPHSVIDNKDLFFSLVWSACIQTGLSVLVSQYGLAVFDSGLWNSSSVHHVSDSGALGQLLWETLFFLIEVDLQCFVSFRYIAK